MAASENPTTTITSKAQRLLQDKADFVLRVLRIRLRQTSQSSTEGFTLRQIDSSIWDVSTIGETNKRGHLRFKARHQFSPLPWLPEIYSDVLHFSSAFQEILRNSCLRDFFLITYWMLPYPWILPKYSSFCPAVTEHIGKLRKAKIIFAQLSI